MTSCFRHSVNYDTALVSLASECWEQWHYYQCHHRWKSNSVALLGYYNRAADPLITGTNTDSRNDCGNSNSSSNSSRNSFSISYNNKSQDNFNNINHSSPIINNSNNNNSNLLSLTTPFSASPSSQSSALVTRHLRTPTNTAVYTDIPYMIWDNDYNGYIPLDMKYPRPKLLNVPEYVEYYERLLVKLNRNHPLVMMMRSNDATNFYKSANHKPFSRGAGSTTTSTTAAAAVVNMRIPMSSSSSTAIITSSSSNVGYNEVDNEMDGDDDDDDDYSNYVNRDVIEGDDNNYEQDAAVAEREVEQPDKFSFVYSQNNINYYKCALMYELDDTIGDIKSAIIDHQKQLILQVEDDVLEVENQLYELTNVIASLDAIISLGNYHVPRFYEHTRVHINNILLCVI